MKYRIIKKDWKYIVQRRKLWWWSDFTPIRPNESFGGFFVVGEPAPKEYESYQGALLALRTHLGREPEQIETILI